MTVEVVRSTEWNINIIGPKKKIVMQLRGNRTSLPSEVIVVQFPTEDGSIPPVSMEDLSKAVRLARDLSGYKPKRGK